MADKHRHEKPWTTHPFFGNRTLNRSIVIKHRLRVDERYVFEGSRVQATKLIVPFTASDLTLGARSLFIGQRGWRAMIKDLSDGRSDITRDIKLLEIIDKLPSFDPFLLREHVARHGFNIAECYFAITKEDFDRMEAFVHAEMSKLIELAFAGKEDAGTAKMVDILLSSKTDDRMAPLRESLNLDGPAYNDGMFGWKGFLYYKWVLKDLWPRMVQVIEELRDIKLIGANRDPDVTRYVEQARQRLQSAFMLHRQEALETLKVYDDAFRELTDQGRPQAFRDFLIKAPLMFLQLGERINAISHIASFWRYRFPTPLQDASIDVIELTDLLQDFEASLGLTQGGAVMTQGQPRAEKAASS